MDNMEIKSASEGTHSEIAAGDEKPVMILQSPEKERSGVEESPGAAISSDSDQSRCPPELNLPPPPPEIIMEGRSTSFSQDEHNVVNSPTSQVTLHVHDMEEKSESEMVEEKEEESPLDENLPEAGELLEKLVSSIAYLTKAPEDEEEQTSLPIEANHDHIQTPTVDEDCAKDSAENESASPSADVKT